MTIGSTQHVRYGQLSVVERDAAPRRTLSWYLESELLRGRIESAELASSITGELLMSLPVRAGPDDIALQGSAEQYAGVVSFDRFFARARTERVVPALETTVPGLPRVELPLQLYRCQPWSQPFCS